MSFVYQMYNLPSLQPGDVNIILQTLLHLDRRILHSLRQDISGPLFRLLHRCMEFANRCANFLVNGLDGAVENELVHCDQGECRIIRLENDIVSCRDFGDEPL